MKVKIEFTLEQISWVCDRLFHAPIDPRFKFLEEAKKSRVQFRTVMNSLDKQLYSQIVGTKHFARYKKMRKSKDFIIEGFPWSSRVPFPYHKLREDRDER